MRMNALTRIFLLAFPLVLLGRPLPGQTSVAATTAAASIPAPVVVANADVPVEMTDLMLATREKFLEGYDLIQDGDMDAARDFFDAAVDMILSSGWVVAQTPPLNAFFKDLTRQIRDAESDYLFSFYDDEDGWEDDDYEEVPGVEAFLDLDLNVALDDPALRIALSNALRQGNFDIPIAVNDDVAKSLEYFLNRGRKFFEESLIRSGQYRPFIEQVFREEELPLDLINLALVESGFKPQALSRARARGLWQFIQGRASGTD